MDGVVWLLIVLVAVGAGAALWALRRERRLATELHEARAELQSLAEQLEVWRWQSDTLHRLTLLRAPLRAGTTEESIDGVGRLLWEQFHASDEASLRERLERHAALDDIEVQRETTTGPSQRARLSARARSDAHGAFAGYGGIVRDLDALPAALLPAVDADAEHESFGYTISHDLRAPIRVVEGFTKILKEDYGRLLDRIGNDHLERVLGAAARMNAMIDALLALARLSAQPLARQSVNLSLLAGVVAEDLRRQWPERDVTLHIEPDLQVQGDPTLLRMMLENLLGNAWKYTGKNAEPCIWFERTAPDGAFTVRDNGAGFDMRFADRLFGVFQRLHSANDFQGTGIGLASVRRIVRRHGGEIWAEAEVDRGASFYFSLP